VTIFALVPTSASFCLIFLEETPWNQRAACQLCGDLGCACRQDEEGTPRKVTSDDYACLQLKLVPRASLQLGPAWASQDGHISAHATLASRGKARVDNQLIFSGTKGAVIISTSQGSLTVTDEAGKVRLDCNNWQPPMLLLIHNLLRFTICKHLNFLKS
jgi:hypothetical protein